MDSLERMNEAMDYIEEYLTEEIDFSEVARVAWCSEYHFKRMFSFLAGMTLSEYIRRRRLTLAAFELRESRLRVIDAAVKYGYHSPDSFARAFHALHGITPSEAKSGSHSLKAFSRMTFQLTIRGGSEMNYRIEEKQAFRIGGVKKRIPLVYLGENKAITELWESLTDDAYSEIEQLSDMEPSGLLSVCTNFSEGREENGELDYYIGAATTNNIPAHLSRLDVPALTWAVFEVKSEVREELQEVWGRIYSEWFPTSQYESAEGPEMVWSAEANEEPSEHKNEIWVPVKKK